MSFTRAASSSSPWTIEACEIPTEPSLLSDFTMSGKRRRAGRRNFCPRRNTANSGVGMRCEASSIFEIALSRASRRPRGLQPV